MSDLTPIKAGLVDDCLADISDVPLVEVDEHGHPVVTFTGNYVNPVNDLIDFLAALQTRDVDLAEAAREGLAWEDGGYASRGTATFNALRLDGKSVYDTEQDEDAEEEDEDA